MPIQPALYAKAVEALNKPTTAQPERPRSMTTPDAPAPSAPLSPKTTGPSPTPTADTHPQTDAAEIVRHLFTDANQDTFAIMAQCINTYNYSKAKLSRNQYCGEDARRLLDMIIIALDVGNVDLYRK